MVKKRYFVFNQTIKFKHSQAIVGYDSLSHCKIAVSIGHTSLSLLLRLNYPIRSLILNKLLQSYIFYFL